MQSDTSTVSGLNSSGQNKYSFGQGSSSLKSASAIEMPTSYHRNADEMLYKTDNVCQKVDAKKQMLNTVCLEQISFTPAFISLYFYFHFIIKMFCFVLKINKMNLFPVQ